VELVPLGALVTPMDWSLALAYVVLTIVGVSLANWVVFHGTFGRVHPDGPSDLTLLISGLAACAIAAGGFLFPFYRLTGAMLAFGGLTVAVVDFAREFRPDDGISTHLLQLGMTGLALTGMFLLVRSSGRDGPLA
jgi:hypothetical protein